MADERAAGESADEPRMYETYECTHKKMIHDSNGILCPRYCGAGSPVMRVAPRRYARTWELADASKNAALVSNGALNEGSTTDEEDNASVKPEVYARPAVPGEIPPSAIKLELLARTRGFRTAVTYARGLFGRTIRDSVLVRGDHADGRAFRAHWLDGIADSGPGTRKIRDPAGRVTEISAKDLTHWLTQTGSGDTD